MSAAVLPEFLCPAGKCGQKQNATQWIPDGVLFIGSHGSFGIEQNKTNTEPTALIEYRVRLALFWLGMRESNSHK